MTGGTTVLSADAEYTGRCVIHLDAFCWVQRDSYLPQGNQGLKAVTKHKLGYDPVEVDPEDMLNFAREKPDYMASYSVSDAVATYYLYTTYVHNFIFSLCTIIPLGPEDVLRKGSGTLCEALLMVQAYQNRIVCPNKQVDDVESFHEGHLLESETYIGGHVECLEAGVFRADIPAKFSLVPTAFQQLLNNIDRDLTFAIETEHGLQRSDIANYDTVKQYIVERLEMLRDSPNRVEAPVIYHLDVGAMYPNIILTNRLQPSAIVSIEDCAACKFNQAVNGCKRPMTWTWRGEYNPAGGAEYNAIKRQLTYEKLDIDSEAKSFAELPEKQQATMINSRLKTYSQKVYRKTKITEVEDRTSTVCMREHSFYVDTVKAFRDRRYDYKLLTKQWKNQKVAAEKKGDNLARKTAEDREILMDSLQLAHKCILNSFYGYVMRKGARWRSMEMAGIVTYTGASLIRQARELVEQVGRPLELDTDGIWCILPASFPQDVKFKTSTGSTVTIGYPCAMLNADVHERYTNHQYQDLDSKDPSKMRYLTHSECSIFFELDGPYKAMVLPASPEEGKLLKKKYVVYNFNGSIAELKGFELKRRGELELVKLFQSQVFEQFLAGKTLEECYEAVGAVGNQWLDVLDEKGMSMDDDELLHLISEKKTISKTVEEYEGRKSTSLTTAGRLADFLGADMIKDKGLNCNLVISRLPLGAPTTERAIPVAIFSCEPSMKRFFLRKWLKDNTLDCNDFRDIIDWEYYKQRLGKTIQKIVTIPAGMQSIGNPCPRVEHPDWIAHELAAKASGKKQLTLKDAFRTVVAPKKGKISLAVDNETSSPFKDSQSSKKNKRNLADSELLDLEDFGKAKPFQKFSSSAVTSVDTPEKEDSASEEAKQQQGGAIDAEDSAPKAAATPSFYSAAPTTTEDFQSWLKDRKKQWDSARTTRKLQQVNGGYHLNKKSAGVLDFVRNAAISTKHSAWQILELQELDTPGEFLVWAMISNNQLQRVKLTVPRILYVNILKNSQEAMNAAMKLGGTKVFKELPHSKETQELYEIILPELKYQRNEKSIDQFFNSSDVEGLYESQVPLSFRTLMKLGCVAKVLQDSSSKNNNSFTTTGKYALSDLEMVSVRYHPYLTSRSATYKRIFIYYSATMTRTVGTIGVLGIFNIKSTNAEEESLIQDFMNKLKLEGDENNINCDDILEPLAGKAYIWIINGKNGTSLISKPPFNRIYRKYQPNETVEMKFTSAFVATPEDAFKLANSRLEQIYRERNGPTLVITQGGMQQKENTYNYGFDKKQWRKHLPAVNEFPMMIMPSNSLDEAFPSVGWQFFASEKMMQRFFLFPKWFKERLHASRFSMMPICNFSNDYLTDIMDVTFSRQLTHSRSILWASETAGQPDLGQGTSADQDLWSVWSEAQKEPVINHPGIYRTVCIELDIFGLAICAIMSSNELDSEGLTLASLMPTAQQAHTTDHSDGGISNFMDPTAAASHLQSSSTYAESGCGKAFK
jgi:DNA polymerase epsilon subunit 1